MPSMTRALAVVVVLVATLAPAYADRDQFAASVEKYTRDDHRAWVINRLMKFNLGPQCWPKVVAPESGAVEAASYVTSDVVDYAKANGGGDWAALENDKPALAASMDAFRDRFSVTVDVDGDDCDARRSAHWIRYWSATVKAIKQWPLPGGKVAATIVVSPKFKDLTVQVSSDGTAVTIRAPKEKELDSWEQIDQTFQKLHEGTSTASGGIEAFAFACKDSSKDAYAGLVISKLHTFKIGKKCLAKLADPKQNAVYWAGFVTSAVGDWGKRAEIDELRKRFSVVVSVDGDDCDTSLASPWLQYWKETVTMLRELPPRSTKVAIAITATSRAKGISIVVGKDGSSFAVTGPAGRSPDDMHAKIEAAFMTVAKDAKLVAAHKENLANSKLAKAGGNPYPWLGSPISEARAGRIPDHERGTTYTKGAEVATQMSSNPHTLVYRCKEKKCTDSPGASPQWQSVGWARAD